MQNEKFHNTSQNILNLIERNFQKNWECKRKNVYIIFSIESEDWKICYISKKAKAEC